MKSKRLVYEYSVWTRYRPRPFEGTQYAVFLQILEDDGLIKRIPTRKGVMCDIGEISSDKVWVAIYKLKEFSIWKQWKYSRFAHKRLNALAGECKNIDPWAVLRKKASS